MTVACVYTFGCKVNQYESEWMVQQLEKSGFRILPPSPDTQLFIINSCTVTKTADKKNLQAVHRILRSNPLSKIIVTGCHSQLNPEEYTPVCDGVTGNGEKQEIVEIANRVMNSEKVTRIDKAYWLRKQLQYTLNGTCSRYRGQEFSLTRAFLMIQEGCDVGCSYCKIFHARGMQNHSKDVNTIIQEIEGLRANGYHEIVLVGINLGKYRFGELNLQKLMKRILPQFADIRFRFSSLNPEDIDQEMIALWKHPNLCHHLHLSIQSGSDGVLARMRRQYTFQHVQAVVSELKSFDRFFSFTADMIVGFPGETESDFEKTCELVDFIRPLKVHIFRYSPRKNTPAYSFQEKVSELEKRRRSQALQLVVNNNSYEYRKTHLFREKEIILEKTAGSLLTPVKNAMNPVEGHDEYYLLHSVLLKKRMDGTFPDSGDRIWVRAKNIDEKRIDGMVSEFVDVSEWKVGKT